MNEQTARLSDARYQVDDIDGVIVIFDLGVGPVNVCADLASVLADVDKHLGGIGQRAVICRDRTRLFVGIDHRNGRLRGLYQINEDVLERALTKVRSAPRQLAQPQWAPSVLAPVIDLQAWRDRAASNR